MPKNNIKPNTVILSPRITEKASLQVASNVYVFNVAMNATKKSITASVRDAFKVTPVRVHMVAVPKKEVFVRGKKGVKGGGKKAYVHLKAGDKIEIL